MLVPAGRAARGGRGGGPDRARGGRVRLVEVAAGLAVTVTAGLAELRAGRHRDHAVLVRGPEPARGQAVPPARPSPAGQSRRPGRRRGPSRAVGRSAASGLLDRPGLGRTRGAVGARGAADRLRDQRGDQAQGRRRRGRRPGSRPSVGADEAGRRGGDRGAELVRGEDPAEDDAARSRPKTSWQSATVGGTVATQSRPYTTTKPTRPSAAVGQRRGEHQQRHAAQPVVPEQQPARVHPVGEPAGARACRRCRRRRPARAARPRWSRTARGRARPG